MSQQVCMEQSPYVVQSGRGGVAGVGAAHCRLALHRASAQLISGGAIHSLLVHAGANDDASSHCKVLRHAISLLVVLFYDPNEELRCIIGLRRYSTLCVWHGRQ